MPTYDYECKDCGYNFEHFQSMSDDPLTTCPQCKGPLRRLIGGGTGIIFKGSGFYVTDNRNGKNESKKEVKKETKDTKDTTSRTSAEAASSSTKKDPVKAGSSD